MINNLTGKKMESTYINSRDNKGFVFDIRRPAAISNIETYAQIKPASFNGLDGRTGLGNRVLRRVNFIKPPIKPRTIGEGRLTVKPEQTLQQMITEGLKIKYEEPDPWDLTWLEAEDVIVKRMKAAKPTAATEAEISEYLSKYPPLGRSQRTRPVNKNPVGNADTLLKDEIVQLGANINNVSDAVIANTVSANTAATKQQTAAEKVRVWTQEQAIKMAATIKTQNIDSQAGQNLLGAQLMSVVQQLEFQNVLSNKIFMATMQQVNVPTDWDRMNINDLKIPEKKMALMKVLSNAYQGIPTDAVKLNYFPKNRAMVETNISTMFGIMREPNGQYIYIVNDKVNGGVFFKYDETVPAIQMTEDELKRIDLQLVGETPDVEEAETVETKDDLPPGLTQPVQTSQREANTQAIIDILKIGLEEIAKTEYKDEYKQVVTDGVFAQNRKKILEINVNYILGYEKYTVTEDGKEVTKERISPDQQNPRFLEVKPIIGKAAEKYKVNPIFTVTHAVGDKFAYVTWYAEFGAFQSKGPNWDKLVKFIKEEVDKRRKEQAKQYIKTDKQLKDYTVYRREVDEKGVIGDYVRDAKGKKIPINEQWKNNTMNTIAVAVNQTGKRSVAAIIDFYETLANGIKESIARSYIIPPQMLKYMDTVNVSYGLSSKTPNTKLIMERDIDIVAQLTKVGADLSAIIESGKAAAAKQKKQQDDADALTIKLKAEEDKRQKIFDNLKLAADKKKADEAAAAQKIIDDKKAIADKRAADKKQKDEDIKSKQQKASLMIAASSTLSDKIEALLYEGNKYKQVRKDNMDIVGELTPIDENTRYIILSLRLDRASVPVRLPVNERPFKIDYSMYWSGLIEEFDKQTKKLGARPKEILDVTEGKDSQGSKTLIIAINGLKTQADVTNFIKDVNATSAPTAGSGMRARYKLNPIPIYSNMDKPKVKGKGLRLAGRGVRLAGSGERKPNPWIMHVKKFRALHPDLKYSDVLKQAKSTYKK